MFEIEIYEDNKGKSEVLDYFASLQKSNAKQDRIKANKIRLYMKLLEEYGLSLNEPYIKKLDDKIWELRPLKDRFLFAHFDGTKFVILTHFVKQTKKTPKKELNKANIYLIDYKKRSI